jgi:hypothetical protein
MLLLQQSFKNSSSIFGKKNDSLKDQRRPTFNEDAATDIKVSRVQKQVSIKEETPLHNVYSPSILPQAMTTNKFSNNYGFMSGFGCGSPRMTTVTQPG